ncbi:MAG: glycosyltransferase family 2 protein [Bacteroidales bacterium]|nr:glycosyltransferase family 2 protein [Bacteroidales bacterium]
MKKYKLSIIIPAYNEEQTIEQILKKVIEVDLNNIDKEIIIIDDCSKDKTLEKIERFKNNNPAENIIVYTQQRNMGKGAAIRKGVELATGNFIIIQDADLEYDPADYNIMLKPLIEGIADVVYGSRFVGGKPHRILFFWHTVGNKFLTFLSNMFTNLNLTDMETGYKAFRSEIIKSIKIEENRFGFEPEITAKVSKIKGIRIYEVGISYYGRTYKEGKKINWKDGFKAIWCILKYNLLKK